MYRKLLVQFGDSQGKTSARSREALGEGDRKTAERLAHTLKGVAANIGASNLLWASQKVESAINSEAPDTNELVAALEDDLRVVIQAIQATGAQDADRRAPIGSADLESLEPLLATLRRKLEADDAEATDVLDKILEQVRDQKSAAVLQELSDRIDDFDFEAALEQLRSLENTLLRSTKVSGNTVCLPSLNSRD